MATSQPVGSTDNPRPRLNPFAFPSDTDFRFVLLIVSVLGSSLLLYGSMYEALPATRDYKQSEYQECARQGDPMDMSGSYAERTARVLAYGQCTARADRLQAAWMVGGVVVVLILATALYWTYPLRIFRRDGLVSVKESATEVEAALREMQRASDLQMDPTFVWNALDPTHSGLAFGRWGRYYVAITGGLVTQLYSDQPAVRAVVLHELAHVRNADVDRTYFTDALWQAFLVAALLPFAASQALSGRGLADVAELSWRIIPLVALVYLTRNAVLRARELYADVRASTWQGSRDGLRRTLEALPPSRWWWAGLWQLHPEPADRTRAVADTRHLFRLHVWEAFGTGVAAGLTLPNLVVLLGLLIPMPVAIVRPGVAALICAPLAVGVVGLAVWRATFAAVADGRPVRGAGRAGIALSLGLVFGQELSLAAVELGRDMGPVAGVPVAALNLVWGGVLATALFLYFRWIAASASVWLEVTVDDSSPGQAYRIGLTVAGAMLVAWLGVLYFVYLAARTGGNAITLADVQGGPLSDTSSSVPTDATAIGPLAQSASTVLVGLDLLALATLLALCGYPLAAWLWRHRRNAPTVASWAFLDVGTAVHLPPQASLRPVPAMVVGLAGGFVYCVLTLVVYIALFQSRSTSASWADAVAAWTQFGTLALATAVQVIVALIPALWMRRIAALHGMFAAFVAGWVMGIGTIAILAAFGLLWDDWQLTLFLVSAFIIVGACFAGPPALLAATIAARIRRQASE